jgi:hypothetical protein
MDDITVSRKVYDDLMITNVTQKNLHQASIHNANCLYVELSYTKNLNVILSVGLAVTVVMLLFQK